MTTRKSRPVAMQAIALRVLLAAPVFCNHALAQTEFVESFNQRFLAQDPQIGSEFPDLQAFNEDGSEFQLNSLRGKYSVLVFGCLT